jgi:hypothetical protein
MYLVRLYKRLKKDNSSNSLFPRLPTILMAANCVWVCVFLIYERLERFLATKENAVWDVTCVNIGQKKY